MSVAECQWKVVQKVMEIIRSVDQKDYCSSYYDDIVNKYGIKCGTSLSF